MEIVEVKVMFDVLLLETDLEERAQEIGIPIKEFISVYLSNKFLKSLKWERNARTVAYIKNNELIFRQIDGLETDENYFHFTGELTYELTED